MKPVYTYGVSRPSARISSFKAALLILLNIGYLLSPSSTRAEGTKQVMPVYANGTGLVVSTTASFPLGNVGSYLGAPVDQRLYIHIKDFSTEKLYWGFHWETLSPSLPIDSLTNVYMRIYDPNNNEVARILLPTSGAGWIPGDSLGWQKACFGPSLLGSPGYNPQIFTPAMNGDYYVEFYQSNDGGATHPSTGESMISKYFDLTVVAANKGIKGRVHCNEWCFSVYNPHAGDIQDPKSSTNASFVGYTPDSTSVQVSFPAPTGSSATGFKPLTYIVAFNNFGVVNNGNWIQDRKSITLKTFDNTYLKGGFDVFLTAPDATVYPAGQNPQPPQLLAPVIAGCPPGPYNIRFKAPQPGDYYMLLDLNGVAGFQNNTADRYIELAGQSAGIISYLWDGKDGLGNIVPANTTFPIIFSFRKGRINIPFYDVELNVTGFRVDGLAPASSITTNATLYWDDTQLATPDKNCNNNSNNTTPIGYDNSVVGVKPVWPAGAGVQTYGRAWNGNGNPTNVTPAPAVSGNDADNVQCNDYGNGRLLNTWAWGITQESTQSITLQCVTVSGTVWNDADGSANGGFPSNIRTNSEPGVNAGGSLYANLVDPVTNNVLYSVAVAADGTYTLLNCPVNASGMLVYITTSQVANGSPVPNAGTTSAWTNTSPLIRSFNSSTGVITGIDFGIEQLPNSDNQNYTISMPVLNSMVTLNGAGTIASPGPLHGSDPEDGILGSNKTVVITSVPTNEQLYYNGNLVTNNTTIPNYNPAWLQVKFTTINSVIVTSFTYAYVDAAGKQDPTPATYTINMSVVLANSLNSFTGRGSDYGNVLNWTGYEEIPGAYYILQRSTDGNNFTDIDKVAATGNGTTVSHSYTDQFSSPNTPTYYRLEWTDGNGNVAFSNVVTIAANAGSAMLDVSPNPFRSQVTVRLNLARAERVAIRLLDSKGMLLKQAQHQGAKGINSFLVNDLSSLPPSVYFVQIVLADQVFVKKVFN